MAGIFDAILQFCLNVIETLGYGGVFVLMVLESMVAPVPSEGVLPFAGFLASQGRMEFWAAFAAATLGTLVGSLLSYAMGWYGVRPLLERYGKYVPVTPHHLDMTHAFFEKRSAALAVFASRFVPVVRHLISIPAGSARMPLAPFMLATVAGGGAWNLILLYVGFLLGEHWEDVTHGVERWKWVILGAAAVLALVAVWVWRRRRTRMTARA